jgi:hypothetical protein
MVNSTEGVVVFLKFVFLCVFFVRFILGLGIRPFGRFGHFVVRRARVRENCRPRWLRYVCIIITSKQPRLTGTCV